VLAGACASAPSDGNDMAAHGGNFIVGDGRSVSLSLDGVTRLIQVDGRSPDQVKRDIITSFVLGASPFVLKTQDGIIVPISSELSSEESPLSIARVEQSQNGELADEMRLWERPMAAGAATLRFVQEPPKGTCEWLTCKINKSGEPRPLQHLFAVEVEVSHAGKLPEAELREQLTNAEIRLFTPSMQEKTHLVYQGSKIVSKSAQGRFRVRWSGVGIKEVSSSQSIIEGGGKLALGRSGGRCAAGWYHMAISAPGVADLWLRSSAADAGNLAKIVVKHKRCYKTGRWEAKRIGPYADHTFCVPSHEHVQTGRRLCREGCC